VTSYLDLLQPFLNQTFDTHRISNKNYTFPTKFDVVHYNVRNSKYYRLLFQAMRKRVGVAIVHEFICLRYYLRFWNHLSSVEKAFVLEKSATYIGRDFDSVDEVLRFDHLRIDACNLDCHSEALFMDNCLVAIAQSETGLRLNHFAG
jgi:hypothetical protein